jgi:beta-lactamase regulating signal transducer with metallopeptidase domain
VTFLPRLIVIALSTYGAASLCGSAVIILCWRRMAAATLPDADRLFRWRLAPTAAACVVSLLGTIAFARFEPRAGLERTGFLLLWLAAITAAIVSTMVVKVAAGHVVTRRARRSWMASAESTVLPGVSIPVSIVASTFPIVAVVGIVRPRMIVARSVLDACSVDEVRAIMAHEAWHLRRRDNARRALLAALPDALTWLPFSRRAGRQWHEAAEHAADDAGARSAPAGRLHLASALLRVARLVPPTQTPLVLPVTALYRGENIEARVRRILDNTTAPPPARPATRLLIFGAVLIGVCLLALHPIHELVETAVSSWP